MNTKYTEQVERCRDNHSLFVFLDTWRISLGNEGYKRIRQFDRYRLEGSKGMSIHRCASKCGTCGKGLITGKPCSRCDL